VTLTNELIEEIRRKHLVEFDGDDGPSTKLDAVGFARSIERAAETAGLERAAQLCDEYRDLAAAEKDSALLVGKVDLSNAMSGEPRAAEFLANAIRKLAAPVERGDKS
jgi:hypothetical protein